MYLCQVGKLSLISEWLCFPLALFCLFLKLLMLIWIQEGYCAHHSITNRNVTQNSLLLSVFSLIIKFSRLVDLCCENKTNIMNIFIQYLFSTYGY